MRPSHAAVAGGVGTLFALNTVTGAWNLWDARHDPDGRTKRTVHSLLMLASDAGFVATGVLGARAHNRFASRTPHRNVALASMSVATAGTVMMWFWNR